MIVRRVKSSRGRGRRVAGDGMQRASDLSDSRCRTTSARSQGPGLKRGKPKPPTHQETHPTGGPDHAT